MATTSTVAVGSGYRNKSGCVARSSGSNFETSGCDEGTRYITAAFVVVGHQRTIELPCQRDPVTPIDGSIVIPKFDGTGDLDLFLKRFQAIADYCNWNDRDTLFRLEQSIQDSAQYVLMDAPTARTVEEFIQTLRSRFGFVANAEQYRAELSHLRRGSMSVHALNLEVRRLVNKAFPGSWSTSTEVYARDAFLRALDNDELRTRILMSMPPPETLSAAYELAVRAFAVVPESAVRYDVERNRPHRARVVAESMQRDESNGGTESLAALQQQFAELRNVVLQFAADGKAKETKATATAIPVTSSSGTDGQPSSVSVVIRMGILRVIALARRRHLRNQPLSNHRKQRYCQLWTVSESMFIFGLYTKEKNIRPC